MGKTAPERTVIITLHVSRQKKAGRDLKKILGCMYKNVPFICHCCMLMGSQDHAAGTGLSCTVCELLCAVFALRVSNQINV